MNIKRVKWSYLNIKKQKLEYKEELKHINDPTEVVPDPKRELPKQVKEMLDKLLKDIFGDDDM